ncbi:EVE domain-containing protein [Epilithonimonas sp. JDS]|nr:EVE domain-containing protein [Epilithonimonas sp. JDS]
MLKESFAKRENLFYQNSWGFIDKCSFHFPDEVREMFKKLFNEDENLEVRVLSFQVSVEKLLTKLKDILKRENLNSQQDERTISAYLAFRFPEKYILYMATFFNPLVKEFDIFRDETKKNYSKLLDILPSFKKAIELRSDFIEKYRIFYTEPDWDDTNLIIQNVLYIVYNKGLAGIYNGSFDHFDRSNLENYYLFLDEIISKFHLKKGDNRVVYNVAEKQLNFTVGQKYAWCLKSKTKNNPFRVLTNDQFSQQIDIFNSDTGKFLNDFSLINMLSNERENVFNAIENELQRTEKSGYYKYNDDFYERLAFDKDFRSLVFDKLLKPMSDINYWIFQCNPNEYYLSTALRDDALNSWKVNAHKKKIKIGDKIIIWLGGKNAGVYALANVTSDIRADIEDDPKYYKKTPKAKDDRVAIEIEYNLYQAPILKTELENQSWFADMNVGFQGTNFTSSEEHYNNILDLINNDLKTENIILGMNYPLNQILYGPPGTGKTYHTISKAIAIANPNFNLDQKREIVKDEYDRLVKEGQIIFTTFHQSMSYEDFIEGIKPIMKEDEGELSYEIQSGIFKDICISAAKRNEIAVIDNFEETWQKLIEEVKRQIADKKLLKIGSWEYGLSSKDSLKYSSLNSPSQYTFTITKQNILDAYQNKQARPSGAFQKDMEDIVRYMKTNFKLSEYNHTTESFKTQNQINKNFVLIIDEINRGNVSQIFGELITLIEDSKRLGKEESLEVTLPYSKEKFGVPSNLYIIGTMNTADRSVESLDTALRRRFCFEEMLPDLEVLNGKEISGIFLRELLETINKRVEILLDRDHTIGHSYFINIKSEDDLKNTFKNNIIPLLQEYFYGDYEKIGMILGNGFFEDSEKYDKSLFASFATQNYPDAGNLIRLRTINESFNIITALEILLKKEKATNE